MNVWKHKPVLAGTFYTHEDKNNWVTAAFLLNQSQVLVDRSLLEDFNDAKKDSEA